LIGIQKYNWPDSSLADAPYRQDLDGNDSVTYISRGKADCYQYNLFNIDGVPDGYYELVLKVNIPALATQDADLYPSHMTIPVYLSGLTITPYPSVLSSPPAVPQNVTAAPGPVITWAAVPDASSYCIQRYYATGKYSGQKQGAEQMAYTNSFTDLQATIKGQYYWTVAAMNCAGESAESNRTNKVMIR